MTEKKKSSRILTFDLLRGYFLVAILLDHLSFFPNGLDWWSARGALYVTTAEGFFLISGLVLGIVRGSKLIDQPFGHVARLLFKRGLQLYITSCALVIIFTLIGWAFFMNNPGLKGGIAPLGTNFFEVLWNTLTLQYFYGWADYLRLYAIFLFVSPLPMWLLRKGRWYLLLAGSLAVWLLFPSDPNTPEGIQALLQPLSWQLLFFSGLTIGFHWKQLANWWQTRAKRTKNIIIASLLSVALITFAINGTLVFIAGWFHLTELQQIQSYLYGHFFDKERLPVARLLLFFVWFWAAFYLFTRFEPLIRRWLGWLLLPFGTNSLYVYTVHSFILLFVHLWLQPSNIFVNFLVVASVIGLVRVMIHYRVLMKIIPR